MEIIRIQQFKDGGTYQIISLIDKTYYSIIIKHKASTNTKPQHYSEPYIHKGKGLPLNMKFSKLFVNNEFNLSIDDLVFALRVFNKKMEMQNTDFEKTNYARSNNLLEIISSQPQSQRMTTIYNVCAVRNFQSLTHTVERISEYDFETLKCKNTNLQSNIKPQYQLNGFEQIASFTNELDAIAYLQDIFENKNEKHLPNQEYIITKTYKK